MQACVFMIITVSNKQPMGRDTQLAFLRGIFTGEMSRRSFVQGNFVVY